MRSIADHLSDLGVQIATQSKTAAAEVERRWLNTYAQKVKEAHGVWTYRGYRWHGFSYALQPCVSGAAAITQYHEQWKAKFYVFDENLTECMLCEAEEYPDLASLHRDIYVSHANMKWTMAFTHEQPELGPYFAFRHDA